MAIFKRERVPEISGDTKKDIKKIAEHIERLTKELEYVLNNIDDSNFTDDINKKIK